MATPSTAAVKAGAKCSKIGLTAVKSGNKFNCINRDGKLIWKRVKQIKMAAPEPTKTPSSVATPTPMPSPKPSVSPSPSNSFTPKPAPESTFFRHKYEKGVIYRKGNNESEWSRTTAPSSKIDEIRLKAFNEIKTISSASELKNSELKVEFGENVNQYFRTAYTELLKKSMAYWDSFVAPKSIVPVLVVTELDKSKIQQWVNQFSYGESELKRFESTLTPYFPSETNRNQSAGGSVTGMFLKTEPERLVGAGFFHYGSSHIEENLLLDNIAHEITHWYQFVSTPKVPKQNFYEDPNKPGELLEREIRVGCNFMEGTAVLFGNALLVDNAQWFSDGLDVIMRRVQRQLPYLDIKTTQDVVREMKKSESWLGRNCSAGYALGALTYEWLIANQGVQSFNKLLNSYGSTSNVNDAIFNATGMTRDEFYEKSSPYVLKAWKAANQQN